MRLPNIISRFAKRPDMGETGKTEASLYSGSARRWMAVTDDLIDRKGSASIYQEMQYDPEVKAPLAILTAGILSKGWEIHASVDEEDPNFTQAQEQADFVIAALNEMPGSVDDVLEELLRDRTVFGTSIAEKNWNLPMTGDLAGKITYKSIKPKDPSLYEFKLDDFSNVTGLSLWLMGQETVLDPAKFIIFANNPSHGSPWGTSELRAAYRWYWLKKNLVQWWAIFLEKYGSPTVKGGVPAGTPQAKRTELLNALKSIQQETALVHDIDFEVGLLTANQMITGGGGFESAIDYCDKQMVKSLICQTLTTDEGQRVGSMALGQVHESILDVLLKKHRRKLEEMVDEQIIRPLVDYNFTEPFYPNFALAIDEKDITSLSEAIFRLISCEAVDPRESWIREYLGLPAREELEPEPEPEPIEPPEPGQPEDENTEPIPSTGGA